MDVVGNYLCGFVAVWKGSGSTSPISERFERSGAVSPTQYFSGVDVAPCPWGEEHAGIFLCVEGQMFVVCNITEFFIGSRIEGSTSDGVSFEHVSVSFR